jgi:hypothetical protein
MSSSYLEFLVRQEQYKDLLGGKVQRTCLKVRCT